jgi:hypothetical protein
MGQHFDFLCYYGSGNDRASMQKILYLGHLAQATFRLVDRSVPYDRRQDAPSLDHDPASLPWTGSEVQTRLVPSEMADLGRDPTLAVLDRAKLHLYCWNHATSVEYLASSERMGAVPWIHGYRGWATWISRVNGMVEHHVGEVVLVRERNHVPA